ncbi:methyltransferase domain-containing protein [Polyangium sp. 6x1]|uniref:methyltransferase domain-containing protein n=1 Tax=Polyangium sp. 6x1 TaxID=3042689 RepID=UPI002482B4B7|nr:methyltransferase domain-containing protein [Polyangium sp. 6x1]MDI1442747.1 methyltransferase domain-containing protein [Polyangium sp. 6x1]
MIQEHDVREFYDSALHAYQALMGDRWHHGDPEAEARGLSGLEACQIMEEKLLAHSGLARGGWALDFGSGIGGPTLHMAKVSGASFIGVTNNDRLNRRARERSAEQRMTDRAQFLTLEDTGYKHLPFPDGCFDAVTFFESVCHIPDKPALFRELARVLKPGGRLVGEDWLQRPFGEHVTEEAIMVFMRPVNEHIRIPGHGTVESYRRMMADAGLEVLVAEDLFPDGPCWGSTPDDDRPKWLGYEGPEGELFRKGKVALDAARASGVFTVGMFVAQKPKNPA